MNSVYFGNYNTYDDFNLVLNSKTIGAPTVKTNMIDIPGGDGVLDLTDYFGQTKYDNRILTFEFTSLSKPTQYYNTFSRLFDILHGKRAKIIIDDDKDFYYTGRVNIPEWRVDNTLGMVTIECDCDPWKMKNAETVVSCDVTTSADITLVNSRRLAIPKIVTTAEFTITFGSYSGTFSAGTFTIPQLQLSEGSNTVTVAGNGNITFSYREGGL